MKKTVELKRKKAGRPRIAYKTYHMRTVIAYDDYQLLRDICDITGSTPASMVRELINESRPELLGILEALRKAQNGDKKGAFDVLARVGGKAILELLASEPLQQELLKK